jgi:cation:H+ antiporter
MGDMGRPARSRPVTDENGMLLTVFLFILGLALLIGGAEALVRGASRLATAIGVSPLVIGLTVVGYGTSAPEVAVSVQSSLAGAPDLAVGNIVGSNIVNILVILGVSAVILPVVVSQQLVRLDVPLMIVISIGAFLLALDGTVSRLEGLVLLAGGMTYTVWSIRVSRRETAEVRAEYEQEFGAARLPVRSVGRGAINVAFILGGLVMLAVGSRWLVNGASEFARLLGISELVIGLTIVAVGTSLPEVATSILAGLRGERDIAVGNVVGSNLFNLLIALGLTATVSSSGVPVSQTALFIDMPIMIAVAAACLPIAFTGYLIARWEGGLFLAYYVAYTVYLILRAREHDALPMFNVVMLMFVIPLTAITLLVLTLRAYRAG